MTSRRHVDVFVPPSRRHRSTVPPCGIWGKPMGGSPKLIHFRLGSSLKNSSEGVPHGTPMTMEIPLGPRRPDDHRKPMAGKISEHVHENSGDYQWLEYIYIYVCIYIYIDDSQLDGQIEKVCEWLKKKPQLFWFQVRRLGTRAASKSALKRLKRLIVADVCGMVIHQMGIQTSWLSHSDIVHMAIYVWICMDMYGYGSITKPLSWIYNIMISNDVYIYM